MSTFAMAMEIAGIPMSEIWRGALLLIGGGVGVEVVRSMVQRPKMNADTAKVLTDAATALLLPLQDRVVRLTAETQTASDEAGQVREELSEALDELASVRRSNAQLRADYEECQEDLLTVKAEMAALREHIALCEIELGERMPPPPQHPTD